MGLNKTTDIPLSNWFIGLIIGRGTSSGRESAARNGIEMSHLKRYRLYQQEDHHSDEDGEHAMMPAISPRHEA
jgi:hypothetical protein